MDLPSLHVSQKYYQLRPVDKLEYLEVGEDVAIQRIALFFYGSKCDITIKLLFVNRVNFLTRP